MIICQLQLTILTMEFVAHVTEKDIHSIKQIALSVRGKELLIVLIVMVEAIY